jgi:hypothetical protein
MDKKIKRPKVVRVDKKVVTGVDASSDQLPGEMPTGAAQSTWYVQAICTREKVKRAGSRSYPRVKYGAPSLEDAKAIALDWVVTDVDRDDVEQVTLSQMINCKLTQIDSMAVKSPEQASESAIQSTVKRWRLANIPDFPEEARIRLRNLGVLCD